MSNKEKIKTEEKETRLVPRKRVFMEPKLRVYEPLIDITLFTSTANIGGVSGGTFF